MRRLWGGAEEMVAKVKIVWDFLSQHVDFLEREFVRCDWEIVMQLNLKRGLMIVFFWIRLVFVFNSGKPLNRSSQGMSESCEVSLHNCL
jgi:hypothetical protein